MSELIVLCAVCFRGSDQVIAGSLNAGILVLLATTAGVLGCFGYFFVRLAQRARNAGRLADEAASSRPAWDIEPQPDGPR